MKLTAVTAAELLNSAVPPDWIIHGILPKQCIVLISGDPGASKTFWALEAAIAHATGTPFMGGHQTEQGVSLIIEEDSPDWDIAAQTRKLVNGRDLHITDLSNDDGGLFFIVKKGATLNTDEGAIAIADAVERYGATMLILDNLRSLHDLDENDSQAMHRVLKRIDYIRERTECGILILHHNSKPGDSPRSVQQRARGSTAIGGKVDGHLNITYNQANDCYFVEVGKSRALAFTAWRYDLVWDSDTAKFTIFEERTPEAQIILDELAKGPNHIRSLMTVVGTAMPNLSQLAVEKRVKRAVMSLRNQGIITKLRRGEYALDIGPAPGADS